MAKYKVDDVVRAKHGKEEFHILEVLEQTCSGGMQVTYLVRGYLRDIEGAYGKVTHMRQKEYRVREMELGEKIETIGGDDGKD